MREVHRNDAEAFLVFEDEDGTLVLNVLCGTVGVFEVEVRLTPEQAARVRGEGPDVLIPLARDVVHSPRKYLASPPGDGRQA